MHGATLADVLGAIFVHCGVGDKQQADAFVARTLQTCGRIDVLVHNAGIFKAAEFLDIAKVDFDAVLRVNLNSSFLVGQAVIHVMVNAAGRPRVTGTTLRGSIVINVNSVNGVLTISTTASYNVSKGGINQLTRVMALSLAPHGVRVNAVALWARLLLNWRPKPRCPATMPRLRS